MSSNGKSSNGQGAKFAPKPKTKQAPHLGLIMLAKDGSNVTSWKKALFAYAEVNFKDLGQAFALNMRYARTKPSIAALAAEYDEMEARALPALLNQEVAEFIKLKRRDVNDERALFALIGQVTSDEGYARVENLAAYAAVAQDRNAHGLLELVVSEHTLMTHNTSKVEALFMAESRYMKNRQGTDQSDEEYHEKFRLVRANMVLLNCDFKPSDKHQALQFMMNLNMTRHGEFVRDTINRERAHEGRGVPATVQAVIEGARKFITTPKTASQASASLVYAAAVADDGKADSGAKADPKACSNCKKVGHYARECKAPCGVCSKPGHIAKNCKEKKGVEKEKRVMVVDTADDDSSVDDEDCEDLGFNFTVRVANAYRATSNRNKWLFTIDSYASESFAFCEDLLVDCQDDKTTVFGIHGPATLGRRGVLPGFGPAIVSPAGGVNGVSLAQIEKRYNVEYTQGVAFTVDITENLQLVFAHDALTDCYSCVMNEAVMRKLTESDARFQYIMVSTVAEREARYSKREVARAAIAREMLRKMYHPSDAGLIRTINHGVMTNCDVTGKDVVIATDIWGRDVASIRGKSRDMGPVDDRRMFVPVMERKEQTVYCDVFHWRQVSFLLYVVKPLKLLMVQWLPKATMPHMVSAVTGLGNKLSARGFSVKEIIVDPARELTNLEGKVPYRINTVDARTHVADAEVEIRTIKERMRCTEARLPYKLPRRAVRYLANGVVATYNMTLRAGETVSPRELFTGIKSDYARDMKYEFGQYVEAIVPPAHMEKNGAKGRSVASIALCSTGNDRGGWWFMSLKKGTFFNALRGVPLPMPDVVIDAVNRLAERDEKIKEAVLEPPLLVVDVIDDAGEVGQLVSLPTAREDVEPIVETDLGTITGNNVTIEQLLQDEHGPTETSGEPLHAEPLGGQDEIVEIPEAGAEQEDSGPSSATVTTQEVDDRDSEPPVVPLRRSERIAARNSIFCALKTGDPGCERAVHAFRMKTARALGGVGASDAKRVARVLRLTVKKAMDKNPQATVDSVTKEFKQLVDKKVWTVLSKAGLTKGQLKTAIRSSMFLKEKYDAAGAFEKLKARLVAGGDGQDRSLYGDLSSPTVSQETIMMVLAVAAAERRRLTTIDITGAYLECDLDDEIAVIMKLDPVLSRILQDVDKTAIGQQDEKGVTYVKLNKALYGTVQAAQLWYKKLRGVLEMDGFTANPYDACLFNKTVGKIQITVCFHVDDLLVSCESSAMTGRLVEHLQDNFTNLTVNRGNRHSYLAINIVDEDDEELVLDMTAFIDKCCDGWTFGRAATSPAKDGLFAEPDDSPALEPGVKAKFHSSVAQLLYLCKRTRVESLCAVNHLASRVAKASRDDAIKLERVLCYLQSTKHQKLRLKKGGAVNLEAYIDASFGIHEDGRSRTGVALMMSGVCVGAWSSKQKLNTKSSTEAEIVGLSDGLPHVLWMRELVLAQGHSLPATRVHQDNQGVLSIMKQGRRPKHRTKHLNIRHFFARDRVECGDIELVYCPTRDMVADVLTKAVNGGLLQHLIGLLGQG